MTEYQEYLIDRIFYHNKQLEKLLSSTYIVWSTEQNDQLWLETIHLHIKRIEAHTYHLMTDINNQKSLEYTKADSEVLK
tara:strand:- start:803 stop:1039 length:237 start_codon:yes stop_codon:yes gene_type:complete